MIKMRTYKDFVKILEQVSNKVKSKTYPINRHDEYKFESFLPNSIKAWCEELQIDKEVSDRIFQKLWTENSKVQNLASEIYKGYEQSFEILNRNLNPFYTNFYTILQKNLFKKINIDMNKNIIMLLCGFAIVAIGYLIFSNNQQEKQGQSSEKEEAKDTPVPSKIPQTLVLVINALKAEIAETLKRQGKINPDDCQAIYRDTESLWIGYQSNLSSQLKNCFSTSNQFVVPEGEESEYDVYLVQIELEDTDKGFKQNADQLARIDAFRRLADLSVNVKVSPRLRVNAYQDTGVYKR